MFIQPFLKAKQLGYFKFIYHENFKFNVQWFHDHFEFFSNSRSNVQAYGKAKECVISCHFKLPSMLMSMWWWIKLMLGCPTCANQSKRDSNLVQSGKMLLDQICFKGVSKEGFKFKFTRYKASQISFKKGWKLKSNIERKDPF